MRINTSVIITVTVVVQACGPIIVYHNPNVTEGRMHNDLLDCEVAALKAAPVDLVTEKEPDTWIPEKKDCDKKCNKKGNCKKVCKKTGGYWEPGDTYTYDANEDRRKKFEGQCMTQKGYQPVELPICTNVATDPVSTARSGRMPPLTENSCVVRAGERRWKIVNPPIQAD